MRTIAAIAFCGFLAACTVVSIDEDRDRRAQREGTFDAPGFVARSWESRIVPEIEKGAIPLEALLPEMARDKAATEKERGRIASEGSPAVFKVSGTGVIAADDALEPLGPPMGAMTVRLASGELVRVFTGPLVVSSSLRDALPFIDFNNFADQIAFAAVSRALNARAFKAIPVGLKPGDRISFVGAATSPKAEMALEIVPVKIGRLN